MVERVPTTMLRILYILIVMLESSDSISVDYYLGNKEPDVDQTTKEDGNETSSLKHHLLPKLMRKQMNQSGVNVTMSYKESAEYYDDIKMSKVEYKKAYRGEGTINYDYRAQAGYDTNVLLKQDNVSIAKELTLLQQDYAYNDEATSSTTQPLLRLKGDKNTITPFVPKKIVIHKNTSEEDEKMPIDFYNVIPATVSDDGNEVVPVFDISSKNVWYVQENGLCWELPILYAEPGRAMGPADVFLMNRGTLKNVIETPVKQTQPSRPLYIPVAQTMNKWCASGPCYGDHTLCLFSDKAYSKLCLSGYVVTTPSIMEQIALVNTINSMRNKVANGESLTYEHLQQYTAADMNQVIYDFDLEAMAEAWLRQCLPGPSACSALDGEYVTQLECTKAAKYCCIASYRTERASKCIPLSECFVEPILGCVHVWYSKAGKMLTKTDVECGHITPYTYPTAQMLWAETHKVGCAYGTGPEGDIRVVCNFSPGAPFYIETNFYCGFISHVDFMEKFTENITDPEFLDSLGIHLNTLKPVDIVGHDDRSHTVNYSLKYADIDLLAKIYKKKWVREVLKNTSNGTLGFIARLVTRYTFIDDRGSQCDINEAIYEKGEPGSKCVEKGRRFHGLCYDYRDPTPGYRLVAVLAPVALFSLILYDLFNGVVRQTNY